jgi:hypothetical protein
LSSAIPRSVLSLISLRRDVKRLVSLDGLHFIR